MRCVTKESLSSTTQDNIMPDPTEEIRQQELVKFNGSPGSREALALIHGQVWDTKELTQEFDVLGFLAPM